jgi:predicted ATP-grasp superfamily ATP-dependent carboligase
MRVFVYEYTCAALADGEPLPASLRAEGQAMLAALLDDLNRIPGVETITLLSPDGGPCPGEVRRLREVGAERALFHELAGAADGALNIAPEFDGILAERCRWVLEAGGRLLGPSVEGVEQTADKLHLSALLHRQGVPTPACYPAADGWVMERETFPAVLKPRHGAGSQATCLVRAPEDLASCLARMRAEMPGQEFLLQPLARGLPASVAFLVGPRLQLALAPAAQHLSDDGRFRYEGGSLPLSPELARRAVALGRQAVRAVAGLCGYVGVDVVLGAAADGGNDHVIEINPRLTTSYLGLRALAQDNVAAAMLRVLRGEPVSEMTWRRDLMRFYPDGHIALR